MHKKRKISQLVPFREPNLSDRELVLLLLYKLTKLEAEIWLLKDIVLRGSDPATVAEEPKMLAFYQKKAFEVWQEDVPMFRRSQQNSPGN